MSVSMTDGSGASPSKQAFEKAAEFHRQRRFEEAEAVLKTALEADRWNFDLLNARGVMFAAQGRHLDALWCYRDALAANPFGSGIWTNLGNALTEMKHFRSAMACHKRAIEISGGDALLYHNLGVSMASAGEHAEAIVAFTASLDHNPNYHMARWDRARSYLNVGNYVEGWRDYDIRLQTGQVPQRHRAGQKWTGQPYAGKRLLLLVEQGFGDTIWVARYMPQVKALGGELIVECQPEVVPLVAGMRVADRLINRGEELPETDYYAYMCSLPGLFCDSTSPFPPPPYLGAPRERLSKFRDLILFDRPVLKVGIVWSGSITFKKNKERAQSLMRFLQSFAIPGVQLYSLQKGPRQRELTDLPRGSPVVDLAPHLGDFGDTAAAILCLDLIIMTDSAVAHLAGALGKPVWVLLGENPFWLWLRQRTDSPWYPSMRFFRQRAEGDWDHVFDRAATELMTRTQIYKSDIPFNNRKN